MGEVLHKHAGVVEVGQRRLGMLVLLGFGCLFVRIYLREDSGEVCKDNVE